MNTKADPMAPVAPVAPVNPYIGLGVGAAGVVTDIIGLILQKQEMDRARAEAKAIDARNFEYMKSRDEESDKMNRATLKITKERAGLEKTVAMHGINKDKIAQVENFFNNNIAMQDRLLKMWGR